MNQTDTVLAHLRTGRCTDAGDALRRWGIGRLAPRMLEIRQRGWRIDARRVRVRTRAGHAYVAVYRLAPGQT